MIRYEDFEKSVKDLSPGFREWRHLLPSIPIAYRLRFIYVLQREFALPDAFDIVMSSQTLTDDRFETFLGKAEETKVYLHVKE